MSPARSLPVLMYHYVSDYENSIAVSRSIFEDHCRVLAEKGWRGVSLEEAERFLLAGETLPEKSFLITFDDGYLDNYLYAMPIMRRYGHQGVMFAVAGRLEKERTPRVSVEALFAGKTPDMPEVNCPVAKNSLGYMVRRDVFCNHGEVRAMEESGVMRVASHTLGHLGVFEGPEYSGFHRPGNQKRTFYRTNQPWVWGLPKFTVVPGLANRAFLLSEKLVEKIQRLVPQDEAGADAFFADVENEKTLAALVEEGVLGRFETPEEGEKRMWREIHDGKTELENILGHTVQTLCWPWGAWTETSRRLAQDAGFKVFFTTKEGTNPPGFHDAVHRFKAKSRSGSWLLSRVKTYSHPLLGALYAKFRL